MFTSYTLRYRVFALLAFALLTALGASGSAAAQDDDAADKAISRLCVQYGGPNGHPYIDDECATAVRAATEEAAGWPAFDSLAFGSPVELARHEAAGWPNYDPSARAGSVAQTEAAKAAAAEEAAGWPNFDSTALAGSVAQTEAAKTAAAEEAAAWPNYDPSAF